MSNVLDVPNATPEEMEESLDRLHDTLKSNVFVESLYSSKEPSDASKIALVSDGALLPDLLGTSEVEVPANSTLVADLFATIYHDKDVLESLFYQISLMEIDLQDLDLDASVVTYICDNSGAPLFMMLTHDLEKDVNFKYVRDNCSYEGYYLLPTYSEPDAMKHPIRVTYDTLRGTCSVTLPAWNWDYIGKFCNDNKELIKAVRKLNL